MGHLGSYERYRRQIILKEFGEAAQQKLLRAKVFVVGAGGLGCSLLQYIAAAGVGTIGIADDDVVSLDNLQRQVLYTVEDIGKSKTQRASARLKELNPEIEIIPYPVRLNPQNTLAIVDQFDIIVDGSDNFSTRYMINDACVLLNKPLIYGAISQYEGQVAIFNYRENGGDAPANYRDLFPQPPTANEVLNCEEAGVLGVLPGMIGTMMANETIKIIAGIGEPLVNQLFTYNALNNQFYQVSFCARQETSSMIPRSKAAFKQTDYDFTCAPVSRKFEIGIEYFNELIKRDGITFIDVRELNEGPVVVEFVCDKIPLRLLHANLATIHHDTIVLFCQTGARSLQAAQMVYERFGETKKIYSLRGGILEWKKQSRQPA